ncbi:MAG: coproporphyrinogen III oxidase, partial [Bacteroidota bacterium]
RLELPPEEETAAMLAAAMERLPAAGLRQYEVASFAKPGAESRHNLNYWRNGIYLGLGAAAHSRIGRRRWANLTDPSAYVAALARGVSPAAWEEELTEEDELLETVMLGLRLREGLDLSLFPRRFGREAETIFGPALRGLCRAGLLRTDGGRLRLTQAGIPLADYVLRTLISGSGSP